MSEQGRKLKPIEWVLLALVAVGMLYLASVGAFQG